MFVILVRIELLTEFLLFRGDLVGFKYLSPPEN